MRLVVIAVGRTREAPLKALWRQFANRLTPPPTLVEVEERRPLPTDERRRREGRLVLDAVPAGARLMVLDERGLVLDSRGFAQRLGTWAEQGVPVAAFALGGADGHDEAVRARADLTLAFGAMTWPHQLARVMLAEQLYRAGSILAGHPYHRD
jgi:23S rRNA (pseudouridine1915-N3)-methyltransferase